MCGCNHKEIDFEPGRLHDLVAEKDREIERLKEERDLATHKCITCGAAAENPEIASKGVYVEKWDSPQAQAVRKVVAQLSASQVLAGELAEALERARKMLGPHSLHPDAEGMLTIDCALDEHTAARQMNKEKP